MSDSCSPTLAQRVGLVVFSFTQDWLTLSAYAILPV